MVGSTRSQSTAAAKYASATEPSAAFHEPSRLHTGADDQGVQRATQVSEHVHRTADDTGVLVAHVETDGPCRRDASSARRPRQCESSTAAATGLDVNAAATVATPAIGNHDHAWPHAGRAAPKRAARRSLARPPESTPSAIPRSGSAAQGASIREIDPAGLHAGTWEATSDRSTTRRSRRHT